MSRKNASILKFENLDQLWLRIEMILFRKIPFHRMSLIHKVYQFANNNIEKEANGTSVSLSFYLFAASIPFEFWPSSVSFKSESKHFDDKLTNCIWKWACTTTTKTLYSNKKRLSNCRSSCDWSKIKQQHKNKTFISYELRNETWR